MKRILLLQLVVTISLSFSIPLGAANYYLSPSGDDSRSGLSTTLAWATLAKAKTIMAAGDTLFIMGGTYTTAQSFYVENGTAGTVGHPMVFKAYGDSKAIFQHTNNNGRQTSKYWYFTPGQDWVVIDGFSYLNPSDSLYIKLEGREDASYVIRFEGTASNRSEHIKVRGIEIDGNFPPPGATYSEGGLMRYAVGFTYGAMDTIESCYIHHVYHATGDIPPGDGTDRAQGTGESIYLMSCERVLIRNNTLGKANHALVEVSRLGTSDPVSRYIKVINNMCENRWGGGLYFGHGTEYSLMEGNVVCGLAETTTKTKSAFDCSGSHLVFRKNVTWAYNGASIDLCAQRLVGYDFKVDSCLIYNNTFFNSESHNLFIGPFNDGTYSWDGASTNGNIIANNIFYKSHGLTTDVGNRAGEFKLYLHWANDAHNWIDPDQSPPPSPASTHWGGNRFFNNCIRKYAEKGDYDTLIIYSEDADYDGTLSGGNRIYSLAAIQAEDPIAWHDNITDNPGLASENPNSYGVINGWWHLRPQSTCINAGAMINDTVGAYVNSLYPGYGWGNLSYSDARPDIGASESNGENPAPLSPPSQNPLKPGR